MKKFSIAAAVVATPVAAPAVQAAEVALKGISAWPKSFPLTPDFLRFVEEANKRDISLWQVGYAAAPYIGGTLIILVLLIPSPGSRPISRG